MIAIALVADTQPRLNRTACASVNAAAAKRSAQAATAKVRGDKTNASATSPTNENREAPAARKTAFPNSNRLSRRRTFAACDSMPASARSTGPSLRGRNGSGVSEIDDTRFS